MLYKLEALRAILLEKLTLKERSPIPVTVYYFGSDKTFRRYTPALYRKNDSFCGYYVNRADRAVVVMAPQGREENAQSVVFHEYVHHLMRISGQRPPAWYNEGIAELFSTMKVTGDRVEIGHPSVGRIYELQRGKPLPLEQLFSSTHSSSVFTEGKHTGMFYAQSWGLLHLGYFGRPDLPAEKLDLFLRTACLPRYADSAKAQELCQNLLGLDLKELSEALARYINTGRYAYRRVPAPVLPAAKTYLMRSVPPEEIHDRLAELEARINQTGQASLALLQAAERNPTDPRPHEVLGMLASSYEHDENRARECWTKAIALGSENPAVFHELGSSRVGVGLAR